jgi:Ca2+/H+ antiporter, TMEM165/GDT1 family
MRPRSGPLSGSVNWPLFGSTFALIFLSELPDKTAFATVFLASQGSPLAVFCGAAGAFLVQSVVAVTFGRFLGLLPERIVQIGSGIVFLILAIVMWRRNAPAEEIHMARRKGFLGRATSAFVVIFIAEWGDLTQLATATLAAKYAAPLTILVAATLALWVVSGLGVFVGHVARNVINPNVMQRLASIIFAIVGIVLLARTN